MALQTAGFSLVPESSNLGIMPELIGTWETVNHEAAGQKLLIEPFKCPLISDFATGFGFNFELQVVPRRCCWLVFIQ